MAKVRFMSFALMALLVWTGSPQPAVAQAAHPVAVVGKWVYVPEPGHAVLLGGVADGRYVPAKVMAPRLTGGEEYRLYTMTGEVGKAQGSRALPQDNPFSEFTVQLTPAPPLQANVYAVGGTWNAQPRLPEFLNPDHATYRGFTAALLKQKGIAKPTVRLNQIVRVDLDGDGADEVLVSATHFAQGVRADSRIRLGDYSVVYLRKVAGGQVQTHVVAGECHTRASSGPMAVELEVGAILDLDGDGVMEIILRSRYYEGGGAQVYRLQDNRPVKVLAADWGA